jgi:diacylglycerol kinase family enzyme
LNAERMGIGVIINPHARGNRRAPRRLARFRAIVGSDGEVVATESLAALDETLARFHDGGIDVLAVCGGDGSFHTVVSRALTVWDDGHFPLLLPLRGGTINNLSHSIGARRRRAERMLAHVVRDYRRGHTHDTAYGNLFIVNGRYYGYTVAVGMVVNFLRLYYAGKRPGPARAAWLLARLGVSYFLGTSLIKGVAKPIVADITCDGERLPFRQYTLLIASAVSHVGIGLKPFYLAGRKREGFHLLAGPSTPWELLTRLWRFYRGFPANLASLHDDLARSVRIELAEPQAFTINGDIFEEPVSVLEIESGPRMKVIRG